jgi:hypothetical protein
MKITLSKCLHFNRPHYLPQIIHCFTLAIGLVCSAEEVFSQKLILEGKLLNAKNNSEPVPFASIALQGKNIGTVSNEDGVFRLVVDNIMPQDTLMITHVSYDMKKVALNSIPGKVIQLQLEPREIVLNEIIIPAVPVTQLLEQAIAASKKRIKVPVLFNTYYREFVKQNDHYDKFADGQLFYYLEGKPGKINTTVKVTGSRAEELKHDTEEEVDLETTSILDVQDAFSFYEVDRIGRFLNPENYPDYEYSIRSIKDDAGNTLEQIEIKPKQEIQKMLFEATIVIDPETEVILSVKYQMSERHKQFAEEKNILVARIKLANGNVRADYRLVGDQYYLFYVRKSFAIKIWNKKRINDTLEFLSDLVVTDFNPDVNGFDKKDSYKKRALYKRGTLYTEKYWETANIIPLTEAEEKIVQSLKK